MIKKKAASVIPCNRETKRVKSYRNKCKACFAKLLVECLGMTGKEREGKEEDKTGVPGLRGCHL